MKSSKICRQCKFYDAYEEFNCRKFKIVILDFNNALKCKYYKHKGRRKRCKSCMYLKYKYVSCINKYKYVCVKTGKIRSYTQLVHCNRYKKINSS